MPRICVLTQSQYGQGAIVVWLFALWSEKRSSKLGAVYEECACGDTS
jgi:hypothetical protein